MSNFEFIPKPEQYQNSNIYQFMKKHNISSLEELSQKSKNNLEWFWESVEKDIGIVWDIPYTKTCLLYTSPSPRDRTRSRMPSSA